MLKDNYDQGFAYAFGVIVIFPRPIRPIRVIFLRPIRSILEVTCGIMTKTNGNKTAPDRRMRSLKGEHVIFMKTKPTRKLFDLINIELKTPPKTL